MEMQVGHRAVEHLAQRLHGVNLGDRIRVETELRETLAAFPELDPGTIQQLHSMAGAPSPELAGEWHSSLGQLIFGEAPLDVRDAMFAWKVEVQQEDWSKWAGTWKTATISPMLAYADADMVKRI